MQTQTTIEGRAASGIATGRHPERHYRQCGTVISNDAAVQALERPDWAEAHVRDWFVADVRVRRATEPGIGTLGGVSARRRVMPSTE
jgi:hypothetical protein